MILKTYKEKGIRYPFNVQIVKSNRATGWFIPIMTLAFDQYTPKAMVWLARFHNLHKKFSTSSHTGAVA